MAEPARQGRALRAYQIVLILAAGWLVGRLPGLIADNQHERQALGSALGIATAAPAPAPSQAAARGDDREVQLAAEVAARVAADVADRTVARLIEAGWGPPGSPPMPAATAVPRTPETVIRVVTEAAPARARPAVWSLPPTAAATSGPAAGRAPGAPGTAAAPAPVAGAAPAPPVDAAEARAHGIATAGYDALRGGDRRRAVALLDEAVRAAPDSAAAAQWRADSRALMKRWSIAGYVLTRSGSVQDPLAASPVLGGAQAGAALGYTLDPLANSRISVIGRMTAAMGQRGSIERETAEAAVGVRWQPARQLPLAIDVERRIALGYYARNAWAARISGGADGDFHAAGRNWRLRGYGEAGVVGIRDASYYAGGQLDATTPVVRLGRVSVDGGAGAWGATQRDYGQTVSRLDVGPSAQFRVHPWPFRAQIDYRAQVLGNARPGSGVVLTVAGEY